MSEADLIRKTANTHRPKQIDPLGDDLLFGELGKKQRAHKGLTIGIGRKNPNKARKRIGKKNTPF